MNVLEIGQIASDRQVSEGVRSCLLITISRLIKHFMLRDS